MTLLLNVAKIAITRLSLGLSLQKQQNIQGCKNSLGQLTDKKSLTVVVFWRNLHDTLLYILNHAPNHIPFSTMKNILHLTCTKQNYNFSTSHR